MGKTSIEWTDASWNPIVGCTEISPGCANCYAARLAATRLRNTPQYSGLAILQNGAAAARESGVPRWTGEVRFLPERLEEPLHWKKPMRIFVCDMGDLFHEDVKEEWIHKVIGVVNRCPQHTFQILTKRAQRVHHFFADDGAYLRFRNLNGCGWPLPNVWLGVSVENQHFADERIPLLLETPAAVRWISAEPLLGPVDMTKWLRYGVAPPDGSGLFPGTTPKLDWVVCGGESGSNARPMHPDWAMSLRHQCQAAGVPFFFKQWGEWSPIPDGPFKAQTHRWVAADGSNAAYVHGVPAQCMVKLGKKKAGRLLDGREWNEFPKGSE